MKGSWLLAPVLISALAVAETPRLRPAEPTLQVALRQVDAALAKGETSAALSAADDAYRAALATDGWQPLLDAGDAYRRVADRTGLGIPIEVKAHDAYRAALARARREPALDGLLLVAEALALLGDAGLVEESMRAAETLATFDPESRSDVRATAARLSGVLERRRLEPAAR